MSNDMVRLERLWRDRPPLRGAEVSSEMQREADATDDPEAMLRFVRGCVVVRRLHHGASGETKT